MNPFLAAAHQKHLDGLAAWDYALEEEIKAVKADAKNEDENVIYAINEYITDNDEEFALRELAIGSGALYKIEEVRDRAIAYVAAQRLEKRMNDYDPD